LPSMRSSSARNPLFYGIDGLSINRIFPEPLSFPMTRALRRYKPPKIPSFSFWTWPSFPSHSTRFSRTVPNAFNFTFSILRRGLPLWSPRPSYPYAQRDWPLAEQIPSFHHRGNICMIPSGQWYPGPSLRIPIPSSFYNLCPSFLSSQPPTAFVWGV